MDNFDLTKFLAEGKLHEAELPPLSDEQFEEIAQRIADELTAADDLDIKYSITPGSIENDTPLGGGFDLDAERGPNTPGDDWEDDRGFTIDQYVGEGDGGSYTVKPSPSGTNEYIVTNAAMMNTKVANVYFEGDTLEIQMVPQDEFLPRSSDEAKAQRKKEREMANVFVREGKKPELREMSDYMQEDEMLDEGWKETLVGIGMAAATIAGIGKAMVPSPEALDNKEKAELVVNAQQDALDKSSDKEVNQMVKSLEDAGIQIMGNYIKIAPSTFDKYKDNPQELDKMISQEKRKVIQKLTVKGNDMVKSGFVITSSGTLQWANPSQITPINEEQENKPSNKMKKSELKEMIKSAILAEESYPDPEESGASVEDLYQMDQEMLDKLKRDKEDKKYPTLDDVVDPDDPFDEELEGAMDNDDMRDNMMEAKKDEDKEDKNDDVEVELEDETTEMEPETSDKGLTGPKKVVDDSLEAALEAARELGDEKLEAQIGNTITFFTRSQIVKNTSGEQEDAPEMDMETEEEMLQEVKRMQRIAGIIK